MVCSFINGHVNRYFERPCFHYGFTKVYCLHGMYSFYLYFVVLVRWPHAEFFNSLVSRQLLEWPQLLVDVYIYIYGYNKDNIRYEHSYTYYCKYPWIVESYFKYYITLTLVKFNVKCPNKTADDSASFCIINTWQEFKQKYNMYICKDTSLFRICGESIAYLTAIVDELKHNPISSYINVF